MRRRARLAIAMGTSAAIGYGWLKAAWGLGSKVGIRDVDAWNDTFGQLAPWQRFAALDGTVLVDVLGLVLLVLLATGRGGRPVRAIGGLGCVALVGFGLIGLGSVAGPAVGLWHDGPSPLATWVFVLVYGSFTVFGLAFATAGRASRNVDHADRADRADRADHDPDHTKRHAGHDTDHTAPTHGAGPPEPSVK